MRRVQPHSCRDDEASARCEPWRHEQPANGAVHPLARHPVASARRPAARGGWAGRSTAQERADQGGFGNFLCRYCFNTFRRRRAERLQCGFGRPLQGFRGQLRRRQDGIQRGETARILDPPLRPVPWHALFAMAGHSSWLYQPVA